jgi:hypothetical protein
VVSVLVVIQKEVKKLLKNLSTISVKHSLVQIWYSLRVVSVEVLVLVLLLSLLK